MVWRRSPHEPPPRPPRPPTPQLYRWASDALVGTCGAVPADDCSELYLDHAVSVHTGGADMADMRGGYARGGAAVRRFLQVMSQYAGTSDPPLAALAAQLL